MRIAIDCDGVLVNFAHGYEKVLSAVAGTEPITHPAEGPDKWYWEHDRFTDAQVAEAWQRIHKDPYFWYNLPQLSNMEMLKWRWAGLMGAYHEVYFLTVRAGVAAKHQTEVWLASRLGPYSNPTVITLPDGKGLIARALQLDAAIDDRPKNVEELVAAGVPRVYLQDRNYNRDCLVGTRVSTIEDMFEDLGV